METTQLEEREVLMVFKCESGVSSVEDADAQYIHQQAKQMKNVAQVKELVPEVWRTVIREVAYLLEILFWSVWRILKDKLNICEIADQLVPLPAEWGAWISWPKTKWLSFCTFPSYQI